MKFRWDKKYLYWGITAFCVIAASILFYFGLFRMNTLIGGITAILEILAPLIYGLVLAYLLNPMVRFLEESVIFPFFHRFEKKVGTVGKKIIRMCCVVCVLLFFLFCIYGLIALLVPEIFSSITNIANNFDRYVRSIQEWITQLLKDNPDMRESMMNVFDKATAKAEVWLTMELLPQVNVMVREFSISIMGMVNFLKNFLVGVIVSIYLMYSKEAYIAKAKQFLFAVLKPENSNMVLRDLRFVDKTFGGFIIGKIIDSIIIGILCYIGTTLLGTPYALLVSVVVGVTNVIPFFGPYIGAIPSIILILLVNPLQALYFAIFILALQQFDGNFLGPKILGGSTGLSSFMVIVAILVGGGLFGLLGMVVGVPICAVICVIVRNIINNRLRSRQLPVEVDAYKNMDHLDPETRQPVPRAKKEIPMGREQVFVYRKKRKNSGENQKKEEKK